ncbi:cell division protein FtsL [Marinomonas ostreistagni]|uniref:Cell division protein FtsL n=1 Tax=Marinomonas ostreistagni TaxID=359209 RepID=A0ABS0ZFX8_9GAMM|nr:cell division protein FtsL [Marinomonas ostreistagni]MBJ7551811.1 cell division protein FtsL [Marinomonas ostreistagni]
MSKSTKGLLSFLFALLLLGGMAITLVVQVYDFRRGFAYLQQLKKDEVNYEVVWGQLLLEQSALTQPSRLEQAAIKDLKMHAPTPEELVIVKP